MRIRFLALAFLALLALPLLAACGGGRTDPAREAALSQMAADGQSGAEITEMIEGDPAVRGADELYCVATDATTQNGELPYLLVVWRSGGEWQATQLAEGYYEWDLQGCPR